MRLGEHRLRQTMSQWFDLLFFFLSKPLFVPPIQPMLRLIGFILKNDDDELEAHPVSAKSTSTKLKAMFLMTVAFK